MTKDGLPTPQATEPEDAAWKEMVRKYQDPTVLRSAWQITNTLGPYIGLWVLMYFLVGTSWWLVIPLAVLAGLFVVRAFIIFHDCTHGSYFKSRRANDIVGFIFGVLVFTPFHHWKWEHSVHHSGAGNLDRRGIGDVWTLTVQEYLDASRWKRFSYRLSRNPLVLFVVAPIFLFVVLHRFPARDAKVRERRWLHLTNATILAMCLLLAWTFGLKAYLIIQLTILVVASTVGVWMFYVQHQFEDAYWEKSADWDFAQAALHGSSYYKLPRVLQWITGNIGFHHIHHLSPRIPNYRLERAHHSEPLFQAVKPLTLLQSLKSLRFRLWDETKKKLVNFQAAKLRKRELGKSGPRDEESPHGAER